MKNQIKKINISGSLMKKIIIGTVIGVMIIASCMMTYQHKKISQLEEQVYLKQQVEDRNRTTDYTKTLLNAKTIQEEFNSQQSYSILKDSAIRQTHEYSFEDDGVLGIKKRAVIKGVANLMYSCDVDLSQSEITVENKTIVVKIEKPYLNEKSVHMENNTLIIQEDEYSLLCSKKDCSKVMNYYMESFVSEGIENLHEYYSSDKQQDNLNKIAIQQVKSLIETLNITDTTVVVKIK